MSGDEEGKNTQAIGLPRLPPVDQRSELPALAEPGTLCFVKSEEQSYVYDGSEWKPTKGLMKS